MSARPPSPLKVFLDFMRPFAPAFPDSVFVGRMNAEQLSPEHILRAFQTYEGLRSAGDPAALMAALDELVKGGAPYFDGLEKALREAGKMLDKERARIAVMPVPEGAFEGLNKNVKSDWTRTHYGEPRHAGKWKDAEGRVLFCSVAYEMEGEFSDHYYFFAQDDYWHEGIPLSDSRPVYRLPEIVSSALPVIVVLGGRAASFDVPGYIVTAFAGGSSTATDWASLAQKAVTVWPSSVRDMKAAGAIQKRLPHARVLDTSKSIAEVPAAEMSAFLASCPALETSTEEAKLPFALLGYDGTRHYFLSRARRILYFIEMGRFTGSQLLELAPLTWWGVMGLVKETGAIRVDQAQDWLLQRYAEQHIGMVDLRRLRGAGVWRDGEQIVVNDGRQIVNLKGECQSYDDFHSEAGAEYIPSETHFGDMTGAESDDAEGAALSALFCAQKFARALDPVAALGWALIAPFGGLLRWRPHLWITGRRGTGKSQIILDPMIAPLCGEFAYQGTGRTTEAGLRRSINMTARPVLLDEFDARDRHSKTDGERLARILQLARNASGDSSAVVTMASGDSGTVQFIVRSCFCFASVNMPEQDAAIESRIVRVEKLAVDNLEQVMEQNARERSRVMADPARYRRRIFRALPRILADITAIHDRLLSFLGDARETDLIAPLLCAAWAVRSAESIMGEAGTAWCATLLTDLSEMHADRVEDEDRVIEHICAYRVRLDGGREKVIAELLHDADSLTGEANATEILSRHGMKLTNAVNGDGKSHRVLALATHADPIAAMLEGTPYMQGYDAQLQRHPLGMGVKNVRLAIGVRRCRCLDWEGFREKYIGAAGQAVLPGVGE